MKEPFRSFASFPQITVNNFPFSLNGKLASLWFDEIVLETNSEFLSSILKMAAEEESWDGKTLKTLMNIFTPITKYHQDYKPLSHYKQVEDTNLIETVRESVQSRLLSQDRSWPTVHEAAYQEVSILESVSLWMLLNKDKHCCFLPMQEEELALKKLFYSSNNEQSFKLFKDILFYKLPDISHYPWYQILEYRTHEYYESYRRKMFELSILVSLGDNKAIKELVEEVYRSDMERLLSLLRPSRMLQTVKTVASVMPLPVPINPISLITTAIDMKKEVGAMKKYGWIYFHMDLCSS